MEMGRNCVWCRKPLQIQTLLAVMSRHDEKQRIARDVCCRRNCWTQFLLCVTDWLIEYQHPARLHRLIPLIPEISDAKHGALRNATLSSSAALYFLTLGKLETITSTTRLNRHKSLPVSRSSFNWIVPLPPPHSLGYKGNARERGDNILATFVGLKKLLQSEMIGLHECSQNWDW